jgi:two-component system response regulator FlrC
MRHMPAGESFAWPTAAALDRLMAHRWPGNVRELENVLQRALLLREGDRIEAADLSIETVIAAPAPQDDPADASVEAGSPRRLADIARALQARAIEEALAATGGHRVRAAERLGISERTLRYRLADMRAAA